MSDEFDRDDLPDWMRDPESGGDDTPADDDDAFDWQEDTGDDAAGRGQAGKLGFTGELPWLGEQSGDQPDDPVAGTEDDLFGWMNEEAESDRVGASGAEAADDEDLPWLSDDESSGAPLTGDLPGWMESSEQDDPAITDEDSADDTPEWLSAAGSDEDADEPPTTVDPDASVMPSWLQNVKDAGQVGDADTLLVEGGLGDLIDDDDASDEPTDDDFADWLGRESVRTTPPPSVPSMPGDLDDMPFGESGELAEESPVLPDNGDLPPWLSDVADMNSVSNAQTGSLDPNTVDQIKGQREQLEEEPTAEDLFAELGISDTPIEELPDEFGTGELEDAADTSWLDDIMPHDAAVSAEPGGDDADNFFLDAGVGDDESSAAPSPADDGLGWLETDTSGDRPFDDDDFFAAVQDASSPATPDNTIQEDTVQIPRDDDEFIALIEAAEADTSPPGSEDPFAAFAQPEPEPEFDFEPPAEGDLDDDFLAMLDAAEAGDGGDDPFADMFGFDDDEDDDALAAQFADPNLTPPAPADDVVEDAGDEPLTFAQLMGEADDAAAPPSADDDDLEDMFFFDAGLEDTDEPEPATAPSAQDDPFDWFAEESAPAEDAGAAPDWLEGVSADAEFTFDDAIPAEDDFLTELETEDDLPAPAALGDDDLDSFLSALDEVAPAAVPLDSDPTISADEVDLDALFGEGAGDGGDEDVEDTIRPTQMPDFLSQLEANVGGVSAAALVRQQQDRPLDDLPDRLKRLHQRGSELPTTPREVEGTDPLSAMLPGVNNTLAPASIQIGDTGVVDALILSRDEEKKMGVLRSLVSSADAVSAEGLPALDETYGGLTGTDDEFLAALEADAQKQAKPKAARPKRRRQPLRLDRVVIALLLLIMMVLPFVVGLEFGNRPPGSFAPGSPAAVAFGHVDETRRGDLVLVGIEYGPTSAAELDGLTEMITRHIIAQGGRPVLIGGNPTGLLHASNILANINNDDEFLASINRTDPLLPNQDYFVTRYLAGNAVGLRAFSEDSANLLLNDIRGQATGLSIGSLDDFGTMVVIAGNFDDLRVWAEQIAPLTETPLVAAVGFATEPLARSYVGSAFDGLLVGYGDAYVYSIMLGLAPTPVPSPTRPPTSTPAPTDIPTEVVTDEATALATDEATEAVTADAAAVSTEAVTAEVTEDAAVTAEATAEVVEPTDTPTSVPPTETPLPQPTATATLSPTPPPPTDTPTPAPPTSTPTPTEIPVRIGVVQANQRVNIRSGPDTSFSVITAVNPGTELEIIGENEDGTWLQVVLPDRPDEAWISATLVRFVEATPTPNPTLDPAASARRFDDAPRTFGRAYGQRIPLRFQATPDITAEPTADATENATEEATEEATAARPQATRGPVNAVPPLTDPVTGELRDERWFAQTLGIIVAATVITFGMIINLLRALFRRGSNSQ